MRILHTSDWHLGQRFFGRSLLSDQEYVLDQMINLARDLKPDVTVVAGDLFYQRRPDEDSLALFHDTLNRLLNLGTILVFLSGPTDDFKNLHLEARWVREAGIYLFEDATQMLSPLFFRGERDSFDVTTWCLPYPKSTDLPAAGQHPAMYGRALVEKAVQRLNPNEVNIFLGYAWAQGGGRRPEFGQLLQPGGQPLEMRLLDFFDLSALGGSHQPLALGSSNAHYSGSLLCYEPEDTNQNRSLTFYEIESKDKVFVETYSLRPRRALKVLEGSWEELMEQGQSLRSNDLIVLRSDETELTPEQRADLRILSPNVVSVELPSPFENTPNEPSEELPAMVRDFQDFVRETSGRELAEEELELLLQVDENL